MAAITSTLTGNSSAAHSKSSEAENPYLAARREWDERYGNLITRERNWRAIAFCCAFVSMLTVAGLVWLSSRSRIVPFVVAMDSLGRPVAAGPAEQTTTADDRIKRAALYSWLENLRLVTGDGIAQRKAINQVYAYVASGSQAQAFISEFYRNDPPQKGAQTLTVSIEVQAVLPTSDRTFEMEWAETTRDLYGTVMQKARWKGAFTIATNLPTDEGVARVNPLGIYVTNASWGKLL
jgi:type IV secretory pathway TrbF-like protein